MSSVATITLETTTSVSFPYNPNNTNWTYSINRQHIDTYGGRVVQMLSVSTSSMTIQGDAGSRPKLLKLFSDLKALQVAQIQSQSSAVLNIPATFAENGAIVQNVFIENVNIGMDYTTVTYPYSLLLQIEDANYGSINDNIVSAELASITAALGFSNSVGTTVGGKLNLQYQGLNTTNQLSIAQLSNILGNYSVQSTFTPQYTANGSWNP